MPCCEYNKLDFYPDYVAAVDLAVMVAEDVAVVVVADDAVVVVVGEEVRFSGSS